MGQRTAKTPLLLDLGGAPRIDADGCARIKIAHGRVYWVLFEEPISMDEESPPSEVHLRAIVSLPAEVVLPTIRDTLWEMGQRGLEVISDEAIKFWHHRGH